jgi:hypothetical protein
LRKKSQLKNSPNWWKLTSIITIDLVRVSSKQRHQALLLTSDRILFPPDYNFLRLIHVVALKYPTIGAIHFSSSFFL